MPRPNRQVKWVLPSLTFVPEFSSQSTTPPSWRLSFFSSFQKSRLTLFCTICPSILFTYYYYAVLVRTLYQYPCLSSIYLFIFSLEFFFLYLLRSLESLTPTYFYISASQITSLQNDCRLGVKSEEEWSQAISSRQGHSKTDFCIALWIPGRVQFTIQLLLLQKSYFLLKLSLQQVMVCVSALLTVPFLVTDSLCAGNSSGMWKLFLDYCKNKMKNRKAYKTQCKIQKKLLVQQSNLEIITWKRSNFYRLMYFNLAKLLNELISSTFVGSGLSTIIQTMFGMR